MAEGGGDGSAAVVGDRCGTRQLTVTSVGENFSPFFCADSEKFDLPKAHVFWKKSLGLDMEASIEMKDLCPIVATFANCTCYVG